MDMKLENLALKELKNRRNKLIQEIQNLELELDKRIESAKKEEEEITNKLAKKVDRLTKKLEELKSEYQSLSKPYIVQLNDGDIISCSEGEITKAKSNSIFIPDLITTIKSYELTKKEILKWVDDGRIPEEVYKQLAKDNQPLPKLLYIDQKSGRAWAQMHFRGIKEEEYKDFKAGKKKLWEILVGHSVHIDLRISFPGLKKLVQYVITENDIQGMVRMMKGEKRETAGGVMNVQHSMVVSKPSAEPPEGPEKFYKAEEFPAIDESGAKLAEKLIMKDQSYWIPPGEVGSTNYTYAYMALIWLGTAITGTERHDLHELFLKKTKAKDDLFNGKFTIKCLKRPDVTARWEIWKATSNPKPLDSIQHCDIGYHWLVPASKVDKFGREGYRELSQRLFKKKLS